MTCNPKVSQFDTQRACYFYPKADIACPETLLLMFKQQKKQRLEKNLAQALHAAQSFFEDNTLKIHALQDLGTFHDIYVIEKNSQRFVLRLHEGNTNDFTLAIDHFISNLILKAQLPATQSFYFNLDRTPYTFDYQIVKFNEGKNLDFFKQDPSNYQKLLGETGIFFAKLHQFQLQQYGLLNASAIITKKEAIGLHHSWHDFIWLNLETHIETCLKFNDINTEESHEILTWFKQKDLYSISTPTLLHGDPGNHNIFSDGNRITAMIDWEDCLAGDPIYDIAFWATFHPEEQHIYFLNGYFQKNYFDNFFWYRFWIYYLRVSLAKTVHRHRFQYTDRPGTLKASTRIQKAIDRLRSLN